MPAKSRAQQRLMGAALQAKRSGTTAGLKGPAKQVVRSMSEKQLSDFAATKHKRLPARKSKSY